MATFLEMQTRLLSAVNRPSSEADVLQATKDAINDTIIELQRNHAFVYTEKLVTFEYDAGTLFVDLGTICGGVFRDIMSVQQLNAAGLYDGKPLKIVTFNQLQAIRSKYERRHHIDPEATYDDSIIGFTIEDSFRQDRVVFIVSQSLGLYPRPSETINFLMHCHIWLNALSADADTNFFLTYANDLVYMMGLKKLMIFLKNTTNFPFTKEDLEFSLKTLITWDSQLRETTNTTLT